MAPERSHLLHFYGRECVHCRQMDALMARLEDDLGISMEHLEIWHNQANAALFRQYDQGRCGGVPFYYNTRTDKWLCGTVSYQVLKQWAQG